MNEIRDLFASIESDDRWFTPAGLSEEELANLEAEADLTIPKEVKQILRCTVGGEWAGERLIQFFDDVAIKDVNPQLQSKWFPGTFAFASDGGSNWYILDVENRLGRGSGAVWQLPAGAPFASEARYIAADVADFVRWMIKGG